MIGLFFEVQPKYGHEDRYFETAAALRPALDENGGILFIDRYKSLKRDGVILSYQHWQDEAHLIKWREETRHQGAQKAGRDVHFADYRIRVAPHVDGATEPDEIGARLIVVAEGNRAPSAGTRGETFKSVYRDEQFATLIDAESREDAAEILASLRDTRELTAVRLFSVARDYTMRNRDEAPQAW
ncbi:MAG: antibiotic biosynthesis monooxygenase family protein [Hyphomicrobiaceae bacterium]